MEEARERYSRTLDGFYPVVFLDAVHNKVREEGRNVTKASYVALGNNEEGRKDILGIWNGENECAKFWLKVCNERKRQTMRSAYINAPLFSGAVYDILREAVLTRAAALPDLMPLYFLFRPYTWVSLPADT